MVARRRDLIAASACALFGFFLSTLPNFLAWRRIGAPWYFADPDATTAYLHFIAHAYFFHPFNLTEPASGLTGAAFYPWIPFIPFVLLSKLFSAGPTGVFLIWAAWSGAALGALFYAIVRILVSRPIVAVAATLILLADTGLTLGRPFDQQVSQMAEIITHGPNAFKGAWSYTLEHFRTVNPGASWPFLGLFLLAMLKLGEKSTTRREYIGAVCFGLLFYVYFYFWTAAALTLAMAFVVQPTLRRPYVRVAIGGLLIGAPLLIRDFNLRGSQSSDWLERYAFFVPMGRFENLHIPKFALLWLGAVIFIQWKTRDRRAIFLTLFVVASLLLTNHNVLTQLELQNYHWRYAWGITLCLLVISTFSSLLEKNKKPSPIASCAIASLIFAHIASGIYLRGWESLHAEVPAKIQGDLADYMKARKSRPFNLTARSVVAGDPAFVDFAVGFDKQIALVGVAGLGPSVSNQEWLERRTLDAWIRGFQSTNAFDIVYSYYGCWHRLLRMTPDQKSAERRRVDDLYAQIEARPGFWLAKYLVRYVALPATSSPRSHPELWRNIYSHERWTVWERANDFVGWRQTESVELRF